MRSPVRPRHAGPTLVTWASVDFPASSDRSVLIAIYGGLGRLLDILLAWMARSPPRSARRQADRARIPAAGVTVVTAPPAA